MKLRYYLVLLLCSVIPLGTMTSCSDEIGNEGDGNRPHGNGIVFGATAGYIGDPETRTVYGDYTNDANGKPISQEILWVDGDKVDIYSPGSPDIQQVEYAINDIQTDRGFAYLAATSGTGLKWSADASQQDFYAVYPSKNSIKNQEMVAKYGINFENGVLTGFIPTNQYHTIKKENGKWVATPTMDWQYMVAKETGFTVPSESEGDGGITLKFMPLVTTLEITIQGPTEVPLAQMNIKVPANQVIMGKFQCDLKSNDWETNGVPSCTALPTGTTANQVTINLYDESNAPLELSAGEEITFNVFLLPTQDWKDISIRIAGFNSGSRTMQLDLNTITLSPHKKTRVTIPAPKIKKGEVNDWMGGLNDNVLVSQLSIPGTANSFSYNYKEDGYEKWRTQTATIDEQWNAGIRCFELVCGEMSGGANLKDSELLCNRHEIGGGINTFGEAVEKIWEKVSENPTEFAIIIPSYDSNTGHPANDHTGVENFAKGLNAFYDANTQYTYQTFTRELTVKNARGSLIFIARITSEEDGNYQVPAPHQGTFVDQWGSLKDNWGRRGYAIHETRVNNWATNGYDNNSVEYYRHSTTSRDYGTDNNYGINAPLPNNYTLVKAPTLSTDFVHTGQRSGSSTKGLAYIQDWQRVVPREGFYSGSSLRPGQFYLGEDNDFHYYYWPESLTEKEKNIWDTFMASIEGNSQEGGGDMFYINSLDGFFVDPSIEKSYRPYVSGTTWGVGLSDGGTEGNILAYANYINNWFYNKILNYGVTNIYGPLNIILMDYVYDGTDGGDRLPSTIINNNFRFPLLMSKDIAGN